MPSIAQLEKLLTLEPDDAFLLYGLAQEHAKLGDHQKAIEYFDKTLAADPDYVYAYYHKARSLESLNQIDDAKSCLQIGLETAKRVGDAKGTSEISGFLAGLG
ncbi:MAG: tetratricopeptide repeat protein [Phycisphaerales bacterium]|nr:tetratricopeptide repeat protein [Phycisphaerales bacterium]